MIATHTGQEGLPVLLASQIEAQAPEDRWLVRPLWTRSGAGILGGPPKTCKSWLGLDLAISVASGVPCLGRFPVEDPGPALVFLAEDSLAMVRVRIDSMCQARGLDVSTLPLHVIAAPTLRLDLERDCSRLEATMAKIRPRLLLLDPLVRLHRCDENSAGEISGLLSFIRELQRTFDAAIIVVHHTSKKQRAHPGQALRGSSDLHAFGDSNAYLARKKDGLVLTLEHRSAATPEPVAIGLVSHADGSATHLVAQEAPPVEEESAAPLGRRILTVLDASADAVSARAIREAVQVNNQRVHDTLRRLESSGKVVKEKGGWRTVPKRARLDHPAQVRLFDD